MPVHPAAGQRVRVLRWIRAAGGARYVEVEFPPGRGLRLPAHWINDDTAVSSAASAPRLSAAALAGLACLIDAKLDASRGGGTVGGDDPNGRPRRGGTRASRAVTGAVNSGVVASGAGATDDTLGKARLDGAPVRARRT